MLAALTGVLTLGASAVGQEILESWDLYSFNNRAPTSVRIDSLPDLDGDGFRELVVGDSFWPPTTTNGRVFVRSGLQDKRLWEVRGTPGESLGRVVTTVGDMDGDGFPDVAAANGGLVSGTRILNGKDGSLLREFSFFTSCIAPMGDVDRDGLADVLFNSSIGSVIVLGGSFRYLDPTPPPPGTSCARVGDVDGDGTADFVVGNRYGGTFSSGAVDVYSGRDGSTLHHVVGPNLVCEFGRSVAGPGDFTGDGIPDFVVGEVGDYCIQVDGTVYFYDGRSGALVQELPGPDNGLNYYFGEVIMAAGDVDGNGVGDLLVSNYPVDIPVVDGATRERVNVIPGSIRPPFRGDGIDWNADGFPDFLTGPFEPGNLRLYLRSGAPTGVSVVGRACNIARGERGPRIGATGVPAIGTDHRIHLSGVAPGVDVLFLMGELVGGGRRPSGAGGCPPLVSPTSILSMTAGEVSPGKGVATAVVPIAADPTLVGTSFHVQWLVLNPTATTVEATTRVLRVEVQGP